MTTMFVYLTVGGILMSAVGIIFLYRSATCHPFSERKARKYWERKFKEETDPEIKENIRKLFL